MEIFRRVEEKYFLNSEQYHKLIKEIDSYLIPDSHGFSTISNIYFDTINDDLIIKSNEKPLYKEKVRLRGYGSINNNSEVFLEIKKKYKGIVFKRRVNLLLKDFYNYYDNNVLIDNQIMKEIDYLFKKYKLIPKLFLSYDRVAYYSKDDNNFRVTFDFNIKSRRNNLKLENSIGEPLYDYEYYVMEIKALNAVPMWFTRVLSKLKIYPTSFSKYGTIYRKECEKNV